MSSDKKNKDKQKHLDHVISELEKAMLCLNHWRHDLCDIKQLQPFSLIIKQILLDAERYPSSDWLQLINHIKHIVDMVLANQLPANQDTYKFLLFATDEALSQIDNLCHNKPVEVHQALQQSYLELSAKPETIEPVVPITIFHEELMELIEALEKEVDLLPNPEAINEIKRTLHTLKGSARLVGFKDLGDFIHQVEDKVDNQDEIVKPLIESLIAYLKENEKNILNKINLKPSWESLAQTRKNPTTKSPQGISEAKDIKQSIRLPLHDVERFSQMAAATNITRSHLEQQHARLKSFTRIMFDTIMKLEEQTRTLKLQADSSIGRDRISPHSNDFDVLEMDHYTKLQQSVRDVHDINSSLFALHDDITQTLHDLQTRLREQHVVAQALESGLTHIRMVPFNSILPRLESIVSQINQELGKEVTFHLAQAEGEMDRSVLEKLITPLEHMIRNAIDHGIESPAERLAHHKAAQGVITMAMRRKGAHVVITLSDDGRGLDFAAIKRRATNEGWWTKSYEPSDKELLKFIFSPGFSTSEATTIVSGRGIGMDIVHADIRKLGGSVTVETQANQGTTFTIELPFTSSVNRALIFRNGQQLYGILSSNVVGITRLMVPALHGAISQNEPIKYNGQVYEVAYIGQLLHQESLIDKHKTKKTLPVIFVESQDLKKAFVVDQVLGQQEILLKSLGPQMQLITELLGASVLGDGNIVFILDPQGLVEQRTFSPSEITESSSQPKIMVVDDSITVRRITTQLLQRHYYDVICAKDGRHALELLHHAKPECILLDLEMPRMDGFTFLQVLHEKETFKHIPVIIISSRSLDKYKQRAYQLGAKSFLSKPYKDDVLLSMIKQVLKVEP